VSASELLQRMPLQRILLADQRVVLRLEEEGLLRDVPALSSLLLDTVVPYQWALAVQLELASASGGMSKPHFADSGAL